MADVPGILLTALDFVAPAIAVWFLVLRRNEGLLSSALATAGISAFLVPAWMFLLNRIFGYPLDRLSLTVLAAALVGASITWHWVLAPRMAPVWRVAVRVGRIVGGKFAPAEDEPGSPFK